MCVCINIEHTHTPIGAKVSQTLRYTIIYYVITPHCVTHTHPHTHTHTYIYTHTHVSLGGLI